MAIEELGQSALVGWRKQVGDRLAGPLEQRTPLSFDQAQAAIGLAFFALSVVYVVGTLRRVLSDG